ncbi:BTB/POZ and MATH domain-containing protein 2-like [Lolium rigidum]|uniref:BTB/POZ and MATH domain-containing protein 2-like n=1 Tax=Lolium rigidum TaxID=89674 RepID=UPI001F5DEB9A|nr:BTB/POZ and MATH domain-containing protein 2-like [Lolium rigidum]
MAFAGVSLVADGRLCDLTTSPIDARADRGYHLLVVEGYTRSKNKPSNGEYIKSRPFLVGGHRWRLYYYPNGYKEDDKDFISVFLALDDYVEGQEVNAQVVFSFIDQPELQMSTRLRKIRTFHRGDGKPKLIRGDNLETSRHLKDDSFVIRHLSDLLLSDVGADITFEVGGETFPAHRCVLAARSSVFKEQLFGGTSMTKANIVEINDMEAKIFYALLVFIYTDSFPDWDWLEDEADESGEELDDDENDEATNQYVKWLLHLLEAADRYDLQRLKSICVEELVQYIWMDTVADIIVVAERRQCRLLKDSCVEFIKSNSRLYTAFTVDSLDQIIKTCSPSVLNELLYKLPKLLKGHIGALIS